MNEVVGRINTVIIIFDIIIIAAIIGVFFFSFFSFFNIKVEKTEDYLNQFMLALKTIYFLAKIVVVHILVNLVYHTFKKMKGEIGGLNNDIL